VRGAGSSSGRGNKCRLLTHEYTCNQVNWLAAWVDGAWLNWNNGQHLKNTVSLMGPLKEDGNCGGGTRLGLQLIEVVQEYEILPRAAAFFTREIAPK
jgi:hypothetical protein